MRFFVQGTERGPVCVHADNHATFVPEEGATVWLLHRPWKVLQVEPCDGGRQLNVIVEPQEAAC